MVSGDVARSARLGAAGGSENFKLLKRWLQECTSEHQNCRKSLNDDLLDESISMIPSRVLDVGTNSRAPRLVESVGDEGVRCGARYVALSHCWGPPDKCPLRTTKATLHKHLHEIPLQHMPKTFRDAIVICRNLEIPYLWIDSLCILQDDIDDCRQQSTVMGCIYERACFTIAASSAEDSSQGLFLKPFHLSGVEIPYYDKSGNELCSILAYIRQDLDGLLNASPLNQRGWTLQEHFLSRRMLHFACNGII
jgi:hypothetical protein